jgi:parvulin-like peptidyl-prolyl isomerase
MPFPIQGRHTGFALAALLLLAAPGAAAEDPLPADLAAMHAEGKWKIRKADLYRYLVKYESGQSNALAVLPEYMQLRLVEDEARRRKISVSEEDVDRWFQSLQDRMVKEGQAGSLDELRKSFDMRKEELRRKGRQWVLMEKVARAILKEKDPSRKDEPLSDDSVIFVVDTLFKEAKKETEGLPEGVVARIRGIDITEYEYGRALAVELPATEVLRALRGLILAEEVVLLLGDRNPPSPEEVEEQRRWFLEMEKSRIRRSIQGAPEEITDEMVEGVLKQRGLSTELVIGNPGFLAQARAIGHFEKALGEEDLRRYYDDHKGQYGEQLKVARILVGARGQKVPGIGTPIRTIEQGKKESSALYEQLKAGGDFFKLAREKSEDADALRKGGGIVPFWITSDTPGFEDTFRQAVQLAEDGISLPFFSEGRGYVIVKLLGRKAAPDYAVLKDGIRRDAARYRYDVWRNDRTRAARVNTGLLEEK